MYYDIITKEIFDSYIENDSDFILEGISTDTFGKTTFRRFVRVPLAMGEHYIEALYEHNFGSFPLSMGTDHFSFKKNLEFMAFIVDRKEICCKSFPFVQLFEDYKNLDTFAISPARHQEEVEHFLEENCQGYGRGHRHSIPFKVIVSVSSGRKVLWENPLFGK